MGLLIVIFIVLALSLAIIAYTTALPRNFPKTIPVIPLWLQAYDVFCGASRSDVYNRRIRGPLEKHGAVALWHEGRWSILAAKPEYLVKIFKNSDRALRRQGMAERVPGSIAAKLFGINIIDADGELYAHFRKIFLPAFQVQAPISAMRAHALKLVEDLRKAHDALKPGKGVPVAPSVWRWALSLWADYFLDTQFGPLEYSEYNIQHIIVEHNKTLLGRMKAVFPMLDNLPWELAITRQTNAKMQKVEAALLEVAEKRVQSPPSLGGENKLGYLMHQARQEKLLSDFHYRSNLKQLYVAGHENVDTVLNAIIEELTTRLDVQGLLYNEVANVLPADYTMKDLDELPLLNSVIFEGLRLYPPLGQLTNRIVIEPFQLDSHILIPAGARVGWHAYGVQTDPQVWGESARKFDPFRWGKDSENVKRTLRLKQSRGQFIPFGIYSRKCLGSTLAIQLLQFALCELARNIEWKHPADYKFSYEVGALVGPRNTTVIIRNRKSGELDEKTVQSCED